MERRLFPNNTDEQIVAVTPSTKTLKTRFEIED